MTPGAPSLPAGSPVATAGLPPRVVSYVAPPLPNGGHPDRAWYVARNAALVAAYRAGDLPSDLARAAGITSVRVEQILKDAKEPRGVGGHRARYHASRRLPAEIAAAAVAAYVMEPETPVATIAAALGTTPNRVAGAVGRAQAPKRQPRLTDEDRAEVVRIYAETRSVRKTARRTGHGIPTVRDIVRQAPVERPTQRERLLSPAQRAYVAQALAADVAASEVAAALCVSLKTVYREARDARVRRPSAPARPERPLSPAAERALQLLRVEGLTPRQAAQAAGLGRSTIYHLLARLELGTDGHPLAAPAADEREIPTGTA